MHAHTRAAERRHHQRFLPSVMTVRFRRRGALRQLAAAALDFNRHGLAMLAEVPLSKDQHLFVRLVHEGLETSTVVAVVHNCLRLEKGYRCGLRFRLNSELQQDPLEVAEELMALELALARAAQEDG